MTFELVAFARGVAVYEMPVCGSVRPGVITALAEQAMHAAAESALPGHEVDVRDLQAHFRGPVRELTGGTLRAEAIVVSLNGALRVEADVLHGEARVAAFECECERALQSSALAG